MSNRTTTCNEKNGSVALFVLTNHVFCCLASLQVCDDYFTKMRRQVYQTPKSYLSFLQLYKAMYNEKINELKVAKIGFVERVLYVATEESVSSWGRHWNVRF